MSRENAVGWAFAALVWAVVIVIAWYGLATAHDFEVKCVAAQGHNYRNTGVCVGSDGRVIEFPS